MKLIKNVVSEKGIRQVVVNVLGGEDVRVEMFVPRYLLDWAQVQAMPAAEGGRSVAISWPVMGPQDVLIADDVRRTYFMVNKVYGIGVRECVRVAVEGWRVGTKSEAQYAFVRRLPPGVTDGFETQGVLLFEADWMLLNCVAVR